MEGEPIVEWLVRPELNLNPQELACAHEACEARVRPRLAYLVS